MFRIFLTAIALIGFTTAALASHEMPTSSASQQTLSMLEERLHQHPAIAAYVQRAEASRLAAQGERGLPDPMVFIQEQDFPIGSTSSQDFEEKMIGFKQTIPAFGIRSAKIERGSTESRKTSLLADFAFEGMKAEMIKVIADRIRIEQQEKILQEQASLVKIEQKSLKGRVSANQAGISTLTLNEADAADIELLSAELDEQRHEVAEMLQNMLGEVPNIEMPDVQLAAWDDDPEKTWPVVLSGMDIKIAQKDVDLRSSEFNPSIEIESAYGRMNNGDNAGTIMVGLSIPLWAADSQKPKLSAARADLRAAEYDKEKVKREVLEKLRHMRAQIDTSEKKVALLKRKESLLNASRDAQTREYETGKADFVLPLKTRRDMLSVRYQLAQEQAKRIALIADFNHYIIKENQK